jgi:hypothetical protein
MPKSSARIRHERLGPGKVARVLLSAGLVSGVVLCALVIRVLAADHPHDSLTSTPMSALHPAATGAPAYSPALTSAAVVTATEVIVLEQVAGQLGCPADISIEETRYSLNCVVAAGHSITARIERFPSAVEAQFAFDAARAGLPLHYFRCHPSYSRTYDQPVGDLPMRHRIHSWNADLWVTTIDAFDDTGYLIAPAPLDVSLLVHQAATEHGLLPVQPCGGPDNFGYTWDDSVPLDWIDATVGTDTGLSGESGNYALGPLSLPFSFPYYENTYGSLYIAASGYLAFTEYGSWLSQPHIPSPEAPNNIVAPYASPLDLASSGPANRVYYTSGGAPPDRFFAVEWYQVADEYEDEVYTFEVVLHENGDIVFQYQAMTYIGNSSACGAIGIENTTGQDGLAYVDYCHQAPSNQAVRFYRPAYSAGVAVKELYQGRFTHPGWEVIFEVPIRNSGELGADTYDIEVTSTWSTTLYFADHVTPLTDTDHDGVPDTGAVAQGASTTVVFTLVTPAMASVGDSNLVSATVRSSLNPGVSKTISLQMAVPARFAQVFRDADDQAMSLYLAELGSEGLFTATPQQYYGYDMAVAETPTGFAYFWARSGVAASVTTAEIEYTLLDNSGNTVRAVTKLTDHSVATVETRDTIPAVAVAPDGRIGVLWHRRLYDSRGQLNENIYFATLDSAGKLLYGPTVVTNNTVWGYPGIPPVPEYSHPRIAATGDNRFVLAWWSARPLVHSGMFEMDIYYGVRDTHGGEVKAGTRFTNGVPGREYYSSPAITALRGNRALLAYHGPAGITYAVLDSAGNTVRAPALAGGDGYEPDAVQLWTGNIVVAWTDLNENIDFVVLHGTTYNAVAGPVRLHHPAAITGDGWVSVAADSGGHAILTWMDYNSDLRHNLYYARVDGTGRVLTQPLIFRASEAASSDIVTSSEGYGNTSYHDADATQVFLPIVWRGW